MENPSWQRFFSRCAAMAWLCLGLSHQSASGQEIPADYMYSGALSADPMSMASVSGNALPGPPVNPPLKGENTAMTAAVADGVTTGIGLASGAVEMNPLVSPSPLGVLAMTGLKIGLVKYAETLPEEDKRTALKAGAAVWSGAAINNLLVLAAAPTPLSVVAGVIMGIATWLHMDGQYEEQDRLAALRAPVAPPVALALPVPLAEAVLRNDGDVIMTADVGWGAPVGE